jgi:ribose 5-phosphate isomerase B
MAMTANRVPGVRAAVVADTFSARATRRHNDSNLLCLGARVIGQGLAEEILLAWLEESFEGGRHLARVQNMAEVGVRAARDLLTPSPASTEGPPRGA